MIAAETEMFIGERQYLKRCTGYGLTNGRWILKGCVLNKALEKEMERIEENKIYNIEDEDQVWAAFPAKNWPELIASECDTQKSSGKNRLENVKYCNQFEMCNWFDGNYIAYLKDLIPNFGLAVWEPYEHAFVMMGSEVVGAIMPLRE